MKYLRGYFFGLLIVLSGSFLLHGMAQRGVQRELHPIWWQFYRSARLAMINRKGQNYMSTYSRTQKTENQKSSKQSWGEWFRSWITTPSMNIRAKYPSTADVSARLRRRDDVASESE